MLRPAFPPPSIAKLGNPLILWETLIILALILANGFFAAAEIAIIVARHGRLKQRADAGDHAAKVALKLAKDSNRFLPTVQIGITLVATVAAAFGGARTALHLSDWLKTSRWPLVVEHSDGIALTIVVVAITFLSVLLGELVPKRLALKYAGGIARSVAIPLDALARITYPVVWFMGVSTNLVLRLLGVGPEVRSRMDLEDLERAIKAGKDEGLLDPAEQRLAQRSLRFGDRIVRDIMQPRLEIDALDVNTPAEEIPGATALAGYSRLPVYEGSLDQIIGYVHIKDVLHHVYLGVPIDLRRSARPVLHIPETLPLNRLLLQFQDSHTPMAVVLDEFGGTEGLVTVEDMMEEVVGVMRDEHSRDDDYHIEPQGDGVWLVDGTAKINDLLDALAVHDPAALESRPFSTVAGLVHNQLQRIPRVGDQLTWHSLGLEIIDMKGPRIVRLRVSLPPRP
ncbi:unnamed protein product [Cladocopium goreaui]|uniref:UPF0053 protein sll0260 n=1 Tax=Cladocopium goreaui TaxID=2562237 RepID=A0A9P1BED6_9DINO|nr:unnamed protein product [Cladocopium goreaui]